MSDDDAPSDPEAAAMAAAMGFSGFGSQRPTKRKFNANADAAVDGDLAAQQQQQQQPQSPERKRGNVSKTGANNAPLGARRQRVPAAAASPRPAVVDGDPDEIDLGEDAQGTSSSGAVGGGGTRVLDGGGSSSRFLQGSGFADGESLPAKPHSTSTTTVVDTGPPGLAARPSDHPHGGRDQNLQRASGGRGGRGGGHHNSEQTGRGQQQWWEDYYDARMNENPWQRLESEQGLPPRGTWLAHGEDGNRAPARAGRVFSPRAGSNHQAPPPPHEAGEAVDGAGGDVGGLSSSRENMQGVAVDLPAGAEAEA